MMSMIQNLRQTFVIFLAKWYSNKLRWLIQTMDQQGKAYETSLFHKL